MKIKGAMTILKKRCEFYGLTFNELIEKGHLYLAQPPLYKITKGSKNYYIKNIKKI